MKRISSLAWAMIVIGVLAIVVAVMSVPAGGLRSSRGSLPLVGDRFLLAPSPSMTPTASALPATGTPTATVEPTLAGRTPTTTLTVAPVATSTSRAAPSPTATTAPSPIGSPTSAPWPRLALTPFVAGLRSPVQVTHAGDGSGRIFVVQQTGQIRIVREGALVAAPFLDLSDRVSCCGERGLLSVAFPPGYASKGHFYVNYTDRTGNTVIARFGLTADPDVADPASEELVLKIEQPYANHNGGQLAFGVNDGYLYIGMGDGGSAGDPQNYAQNPAVLLGKLLRIDVEAVASPGASPGPSPYVVPDTNPFALRAGYRAEIWALGLRNPWRFTFDRANGDLYLADVGQNLYEEVNYQPAASRGGENYGWRIMEGQHCYNAAGCEVAGLTLPVAEYDHSQGCSVTGGVVYRGAQFDGLAGIYLYGDYCSGKIWGLRQAGSGWANQFLAAAPFNITAFGEDEPGEVYVADYGGGQIYRISGQAD